MTPEGRIKSEICAWLSVQRDCLFWVQESQGTFDPRRKVFRKKRSRFQRNGVPDVILLLKVDLLPPVFVGLEVKTKTGRMTDSQKEMERDLIGFGSFYFVVRSRNDAERVLNDVRKQVLNALGRENVTSLDAKHSEVNT